MIDDVWRSLPARYPGIELDEFIIMPNHIHFIAWLNVGAPIAVVQDGDVESGAINRTNIGATLAVAHDRAGASPAPTLGRVVGGFKSLVFKAYRDWVESHDASRREKFWQRNYYEHIIRNDRELDAIRLYIIQNPVNWELDQDNLNNNLRLPPPKTIQDYLHGIQDLQ